MNPDTEIETRLNQAEEALRTSAERYQRLLGAVTDYVYTVEVQDGRPVTTAHSPGCLVVTGYAPEDYAADPHLWRRMVYEQDRSAVTEQAAQVLSGEAALPLEHRLIHRDGSIRWVRNTPMPRHDEHGRLVAYDGLIADITVRKQAEEVLRESEHRLHLISDNIPAYISYLDQTRCYRFVNQHYAESFGMPTEAFTGKLYRDIVGEDYYLKSHQNIEKALSGQPISYEASIVLPPGGKRWMMVSYVPDCDAQGNVRGLFILGNDITERKQAEERLELEAMRLQTLLELHKMMDASPDQLLDFALSAITKTTTSPLASISLLDQAEAVMTSHDWSKDAMAQRAVETNLRHFSIAEAELWGECLRQRQPIIVNGYAKMKLPDKETLPSDRVPIERFLAVPIFDGPRIVAVAAVANKASDYTESDSTTLTLLTERLWGILRRQQAETALRESNAYLENLINCASAPIMVWDPHFRITRFNHAFEFLTGRSEAEVIGQSLEILFPHALTPPSMALMRKTLTGERLEAVEIKILHRDESVHTLLWNSATLFAPDGQTPIAIIAQGLDITVRKQAEEALEHRERVISRILESIPSSLVVIDRSLRIVSANRNFLDKVRREVQTTLGHKIEEVFPHVLLEYTQMDQKVRDIFRTGQSVEGGKVAYRAPGIHTRIYYYRLIPLKAKETVENVMLLMDDITEREHLGEEVRRAERHLASVVECANDLVVSIDPQGCVVTWNPAAERTLGLKAEKVKGQTLISLCAAEYRPVMADVLHGLLRNEKVHNTEVSLLTATGQEVSIAWSCSPMLDDAGKVGGIVAVGRDLTERHQLETQLIQSAKMAALGSMAGGIAHEVRNPLGIISVNAQLLLEHPNDFELHIECARRMHAAAQRASLIIESLLKFARPRSERTREVDLRAALEDTFVFLGYQLALQKVALVKAFQPDLPSVYCNLELLQQVFTNLILNACNAMPTGGTLTVETRACEADHVEICFKDTGQGIPPEHLAKVFDPFFTTMPVGKGVGLGLSISYNIIQQHQGVITVTSQVGQGTTFTIRLPRRPDRS